MIIYNITINIEDSVHEEWLEWMKTVHIPDVMKTGMFTDSRILRVLVEESLGGQTYSVQYTCDSLEKYQQYESTISFLNKCLDKEDNTDESNLHLVRVIDYLSIEQFKLKR